MDKVKIKAIVLDGRWVIVPSFDVATTETSIFFDPGGA